MHDRIIGMKDSDVVHGINGLYAIGTIKIYSLDITDSIIGFHATNR